MSVFHKEMYSDNEVLLPDATKDINEAERFVGAAINSLVEKGYKTRDVEFALLQYVSCKCTSDRLMQQMNRRKRVTVA
jgi:hypothetical protein